MWTCCFVKLCPTMQANVGLYRDDVLVVVKNANGPKLNKLGKEIIAIFKGESLSVTIETNLIETDFWGATFNLPTGKYFPYLNPNNDPFCINMQSNRPNTIKKELPRMTDKMISEHSCNKEKFDKAKGIYEKTINETENENEMKMKL